MDGLYATETWPQVAMITVVIGGGAAILAGRAIAETWRPYWHVVIYMLLLGGAVRFVHFALFEAELLSLPSYLVDTVFLLLCASAAWRMTLAGKMVRQYAWMYERAGPFQWRDRQNKLTPDSPPERPAGP